MNCTVNCTAVAASSKLLPIATKAATTTHIPAAKQSGAAATAGSATDVGTDIGFEAVAATTHDFAAAPAAPAAPAASAASAASAEDHEGFELVVGLPSGELERCLL